MSDLRTAHLDGEEEPGDSSSHHVAASRIMDGALTAAQLQLLTDTVPALISYVDRDARYRYVNRAYETWFGKTREQVLGRHMSEVLGEAAWTVVGPRIKEALNGTSMMYDGELDYRDGGSRFVRATYTPDRSEKGSVRGVVVLVTDITAQRRAEEAFREGNRNLGTIIESIKDYAIFTTDPSGIVASWNIGAERLFGYATNEIIGRNSGILFVPEDQERGVPEQELSEAAKSGRAGDDRWHLRKDGSRFFASGVVTPIQGSGGRSRGFIKIARDVTEKKEAESRLKASEERQRFLADLAQSTQPLTDPDEIVAVTARILGEHLAVNRCAYADVEADEDHFQLTGDYTSGVSSILGHYAFSDFGHEVLRLMRAGEPYVVNDVDTDERAGTDLSAYRKTEIRAVICVPLLKQGRLSAAMAVHQKIPREWTSDEIELVQIVVARCWEAMERAKVSRDLKESMEQFRRAIEDAPIPVIMQADDGQVLQISKTWSQLTGYRPDEVATFEAWLATADGRGAEQVRQAIRNVFSDGSKIAAVDFDILARNGQQRTWSLSVSSPGVLQDGRRFVVGMALDVTERKRVEQTLKEADQRKDEFLATLAHELRNPLAPIRNGLAVLRFNRCDPAATAKVQQMMERQVGHMVRLIDDLLDISRVSRGKVRLKLERISLRSIIDAAIETSRPLIDAGRHELSVTLPDEELELMADSTRMAQIVSNLLNNAAKYTPEQGRIGVNAEREGDYVVIRVSDNGIGIPTDMFSELFEIFTQAGRSIDRAQGGLGIGLSLVRKLVEMHGGTVEAESAGPGHGSTFTVRIPLVPTGNKGNSAPANGK